MAGSFRWVLCPGMLLYVPSFNVLNCFFLMSGIETLLLKSAQPRHAFACAGVRGKTGVTVDRDKNEF